MRIALTVGPDCVHSANAAERRLIETGHIATVFADGMTFESAVRDRLFDAVIDIHLGEMASPYRLTAASLLGLPQIISVGGVSTATAERQDVIGKTIVERASASNGPTRIVLPMGESMPILFESIRNWVYPPSLLVEVDSRLDTDEFGERLAQEFFSLIGSPP